MLDFLKKVNIELTKKYENNPEKLIKQLMIYNFLKYDDCFFKVTIEDAFSILKDLEISNYEETYINLVSYDKYN